ncbi:hypothetical protein [Kamptonema formosum]|uniref:hypothetical protein n=1 Tax=Kamptonema formosum TaxID=331992 RepID=UPI000345B450|nr:hypothetical protein [Oscillatoria sp. PCC 10802]
MPVRALAAAAAPPARSGLAHFNGTLKETGTQGGEISHKAAPLTPDTLTCFGFPVQGEKNFCALGGNGALYLYGKRPQLTV